MGAALKDEKLDSGTVIAGRYRIEQSLGEGGMGSVYLVQHVHTDERFAMKMLHPSIVGDQNSLERFRREARAPARIDSDHVARVTDADVAQELGVPYLVMEYLRGEDLEHLVLKRGSLPPAEVVLYLAQAARALDKAHAIGIVHRDLKPDNLFLTKREDGSPLIKLLDFGIAKLGGSSSDIAQHGSKTSTGQIFGTPLYMSPEQVKGESANVSPETDVWALGIIAYRLLTGEDFWKAETLTHLVALIAYEPIKAPSKQHPAFGPEFDAWFLRCCAREPRERFPSAGEAIAALAKALGLSQIAPLSALAGRSHVPPPPSSLRVVPVAREATDGEALAKTTLSADHDKKAQPRSMLPIALLGALLVGGVGVAAWRVTAVPAVPPAPSSERPIVSVVVVPAPPVVSAAVVPVQSAAPSASAVAASLETGKPEPPRPPPLAHATAKPTQAPTAAPAPTPTVAPVQTAKPVSSDPFGGRQ